MNCQFSLFNFLLSIVSPVWYSCLSSPQSLIKTLEDYFSDIPLLLWKCTRRVPETLENLKMQFRLLHRWIWAPRLFIKLKITIRQLWRVFSKPTWLEEAGSYYLLLWHLLWVYCTAWALWFTKKYNTWTLLSRDLSSRSSPDVFLCKIPASSILRGCVTTSQVPELRYFFMRLDQV